MYLAGCAFRRKPLKKQVFGCTVILSYLPVTHWKEDLGEDALRTAALPCHALYFLFHCFIHCFNSNSPKIQEVGALTLFGSL